MIEGLFFENYNLINSIILKKTANNLIQYKNEKKSRVIHKFSTHKNFSNPPSEKKIQYFYGIYKIDILCDKLLSIQLGQCEY